ncbi:MAG: hypothetical protein LAT76_06655 [Schleiferiaceae bacterium]|nr:hypothetical protein [Schleiferiaceae bacterium]
MFFEDPPEWHLQKGLGFLIMSLALGIPLWLKQKTPVVKLLLIAGFIGLVFQHQYLLTTPLKIVTLIEEDNPFENLLHLEDSADFVIPEGPFIAFTYNKGCGGCIRIANKLKSLQSSNFPPLYTIKLVTKRDKEPRNIPNYVKNLGLPAANYLIADTTVQNRHSAALAPTTYFYNPNQGLQTLEGYEVHVLDQLYHQFQQNPSWFSRLVPESWYTSLAPYLALLTIVLLFFGQSISTTIKKRKQSPTP